VEGVGKAFFNYNGKGASVQKKTVKILPEREKGNTSLSGTIQIPNKQRRELEGFKKRKNGARVGGSASENGRPEVRPHKKANVGVFCSPERGDDGRGGR